MRKKIREGRYLEGAKVGLRLDASQIPKGNRGTHGLSQIGSGRKGGKENGRISSNPREKREPGTRGKRRSAIFREHRNVK